MRRISVIVLLLCTLLIGVAQKHITTSDLPYLCDFEDDTENANWVLNPGIEKIITDNRWVIGSASASTGSHSLYVSADGGRTNTYVATNNVLIAYRDVSLDKGKYDVAFDWKGMGLQGNGYLKVVFESRDVASTKCLGNHVEPGWVSYAVSCMGSDSMLNGRNAWQHTQTTITVPRALANMEDTRILFVWVNNNVEGGDSTSVAIDNFQLAKASPANLPCDMRIVAQKGKTTVSWNGQADYYEICYKRKGDEVFVHESTDSTSFSLQMNEHAYGVYEVWVRGVYGNERTVYAVCPVVCHYGQVSIDALNMPNATYEFGWWKKEEIQKAINGNKRVDYGCEDGASRYTVHYDTTETDPRTAMQQNGKAMALRTIPQGEIGSARVGGWNMKDFVNNYSSITYHYNVMSEEESLLLIRYAIVMSYASSHQNRPWTYPWFEIEIKDVYGKVIPAGQSVFRVPARSDWSDALVRATWNEVGDGAITVLWRDWHTWAVDLSDYVGQELNITLTAAQCNEGGCYAYVYYTMDCVSEQINGVYCGDAQEVRYTAPEGFAYRWYSKNAPDKILSTERVFAAQHDDSQAYIVEITDTLDVQRQFTMSTCALRTCPVPVASYNVRSEGGGNYVRFTNTSHIRTIDAHTGDVVENSAYALDSVRWDFGELSGFSTVWAPEIEIPAAGGSYTVALTAFAGGCDSTTYINVIVPSVPTSVDDKTGDMPVTTRIVRQGEMLTVSIQQTSMYAWYAMTGQCVAAGVVKVMQPIITPQEVGWYILRIYNSEECITEKVIVQ